MQRKFTIPVFGIVLFLFFWINLPSHFVEALRARAVSSFYKSTPMELEKRCSQLQIENLKLKQQIAQALDWLQLSRVAETQYELLKEMELKPFLKRRKEHLQNLLIEETFSMPARVIYRDPSSWSSTVWVNVGASSNRALDKTVIAKNSPVLADGSLVGVVEYVGENQSRIRLITDSGLCPSVRAVRGRLQNLQMARHLEALLEKLEGREDLFDSSLEKEHHISSLIELKAKMQVDTEDCYLAKGEIHGSSSTLWRSRSPILKGVGFNYEYADEEGPSRSLDGEILKVGDLLVTTGLDGVFPPGIPVGSIIRTSELKQGSYCYSIDVRPTVSNINDLESLFILPPIE